MFMTQGEKGLTCLTAHSCLPLKRQQVLCDLSLSADEVTPE